MVIEQDSPPQQQELQFRRADFDSLPEAMDYAAQSDNALHFNNARGVCEHTLTYAEVRENALSLAKRLLGLGFKRGQHIGIFADMHPDFISMFYACQYGGFVAVPLPVVSGLGGRRGYELQLARIFETSDIQMVASMDSLDDTVQRVAKSIPDEHIMTVSELMEHPESDETPVALGPDEISHIQFSSGSTRFPLGVEISQEALMANVKSIAIDALHLQPSDRVVSWLPFYHDMGLIGQCITPATCQLTIDFLYPSAFSRRPLQWLKLMSDRGCTLSFSPDFGYEICSRLAKKQDLSDLDLSRWRVAGVGGDMVKPHALKQFAETFAPHGFKESVFAPSYGLAEATLAFCFESLGNGVQSDLVDKEILTGKGQAVPAGNKTSSTRTFASCGMPLPGYHAEIRNKAGEVLPERHVGEILISGPSLMAGYYKQPEATRQCIGSDGWLNTGDMGYMVDGQLYITGRSKDLIIVKGRNIWPQDLEWHIEREIDGLQGGHTAAFGHRAADGEETTVVLVQCRGNDPDKRQVLKKEVAAAVLRNAGIVCQVELIPPRSLPFTTSGKLIRSKAKKNWLEGGYQQEPVNTVSQHVAL